MAKFKYGIFGPFTGKLGTLIVATWRGVAYVKSAPKPSEKPRTAAQTANSAKFAFLSTWLAPFHDYVLVGYAHKAEAQTPINLAFSHHLRRAVTGVYPNFYIDYAQVMVSVGELKGFADFELHRNTDGRIDMQWSAITDRAYESHNDQLMFVAYCPALGEIDGFLTGPERKDQNFHFQLKKRFVHRDLEIYVAVINHGAKKNSDSLYLGRWEGNP